MPAKATQWIVLVTRTTIFGGVAALWFMWLFALNDWLGGLIGTIVAILVAPALLLYPIIHWLVEGTWPITYLIILAASIAATLVNNWLDDEL